MLRPAARISALTAYLASGSERLCLPTYVRTVPSRWVSPLLSDLSANLGAHFDPLPACAFCTFPSIPGGGARQKGCFLTTAKVLAKFSLGGQTDAVQSEAVPCFCACFLCVNGQAKVSYFFLCNLRLSAFSVCKWPGKSQFCLCNIRLCFFCAQMAMQKSVFAVQSKAVCFFCVQMARQRLFFCCAIQVCVLYHFFVCKWSGEGQFFLLCNLRLCAFSVRKWPGESQCFSCE